MKDFDTERHERNAEREARIGERTFVLGGETFEFVGTSSYTVLARVAATGDMSAIDTIEAFEEAICDFLESGQQERFLKVARNKEDPLTFEDLNDVCFYITEKQSGRPTLAPSPFIAGATTTEISSTEDLSSTPAEVSTA